MARKSPPAPEQGGRIVDIDVRQEMQSSFLEYAYSVIYSRALPDARDGLKPVQRRILFQMAQMGLRPDRGHVKSARVVGEVMGRLHPHGDTAIYDALVRMAQPFALRLPLVDGHGNFGSLDDGPAAMRYTEARLAPSAMDMTATLDEDVVDFIANYDGREQEPVVLPAAIPNLLVNGAAGIAVGMATNLVPHNLVEVVNAARLLISKPRSSLDDIMAVLPGPDLPGGGIIIGLDGIRDAYATGRGSFRVRARASIEQVSARRRGIVVTELPMAVGPERIIERVKDLVGAKKIEGIADITDLSDGDSGLRLVIEVKSGYHPEAVLESLYRLTPMEDAVNINAVALVEGQPHTLGLLDLLAVFINHRLEVVRRRSAFRRARAADRLHLVEGMLIAILEIDEVIQLIRASDDAATARERLMSVFDLTEVQANYILEMPLRRLTKFSRIELEKERTELQETITALERLLKDDKALRTAVSDELAAVARTHGTPRRSVLASEDGVVVAQVPLQEADEPCLVMLSGTGMIGRLPASADQLAAWAAGEQDGPLATEVVASAVATTSRGQVGLVTSSGQVVRVDVMDLPMLPQGAPIGALVNTPVGDTLLCLMPLDDAGSLLLGTASGIVKRVTADFPASKDQWEVIRLAEGDQVVAASTLPEAFAERCDLVLITDDAQLLRFAASDVRAQGRAGGGVQGIRLSPGAKLLACAPVPAAAGSQAVVVTVAGSQGALPGTEGASVKVTALQAFPRKGRATAGVRCHKFRADEDALTAAWAGLAPARAVSIAGAPIRLPAADERRDGTGSPVPAPIAAIGGRWW
ncbi:MAG: DNA topoisomerase (ATP-hydrolyzing) subunit A [Actinomycetales bacterium]